MKYLHFVHTCSPQIDKVYVCGMHTYLFDQYFTPIYFKFNEPAFECVHRAIKFIIVIINFQTFLLLPLPHSLSQTRYKTGKVQTNKEKITLFRRCNDRKMFPWHYYFILSIDNDATQFTRIKLENSIVPFTTSGNG